MEHRVSHVSEPSLPLKSSSSLLKSLALSDIPGVDNDRRRGYRAIPAVNSEPTWWNGGIAALGRVAKAVIDMSPPSKGAASFEDAARQASTGVGLGLAKGGEGVRKVKSNWELDRSVRLSPQEQRPPLPRFNSNPGQATPEQNPSSAYHVIPAKVPSVFNSPPPPPAIEVDAFGYCPLPEDYEVQCDDDDMLYGTGFEDVDSLGSSPSRASSEERETDGIDTSLGMSIEMGSGSTTSSDGLGGGLLDDAVEYDEQFDSPVKASASLSAVVSVRPMARRSSTSPEPVQEEPEPPKPTLKYGDRATRLRIAKSTPAFTRSSPPETWLGTIRSAVLGNAQIYQPIPNGPETAKVNPAPIRISRATPALPTLVTTSPVICDSISTEAEDLPALPLAVTIISPVGPLSSIALRLRPSLAKLREAMGTVEKPKSLQDGTSPTLSPRLDWGAQGEQFAGWNREKKRDALPWGPEYDSLGITIGKEIAEIDYTKSFFYKPPTPPHPSHKSTHEDTTTSEPIPSTAAVARRQRSIKSLRAALLIPVAPPPVPPIPSSFRSPSGLCTPPMDSIPRPYPPVLAISSPGAWEAGLPPRELVLEGEEWDARDGGAVGEWGRKKKGKKRSLKKKTSAKDLAD